jgi:hypothetical protein
MACGAPQLRQDIKSSPSMNARDRIAYFLGQWLQLTQLECQAIQKGDWMELTSIQTTKASLQPSLRTTLDLWKKENAIAGRPDESQPFYRAAVDHLLALETRNIELLIARKESLLERKRWIEQSARNLRMVRDSYARKPAIAWQALS